MIKYFFEKTEEEITKEISSMLSQSISIYDNYKTFYHGFLVGIFQNVPGYKIYSNVESGEGRCDIMLEPVGVDTPAIVVEVKRTKNRRHLAAKCEEALAQIENNRYIERL